MKDLFFSNMKFLDKLKGVFEFREGNIMNYIPDTNILGESRVSLRLAEKKIQTWNKAPPNPNTAAAASIMLYGEGQWVGPEGGKNVRETCENLYRNEMELDMRTQMLEENIIQVGNGLMASNSEVGQTIDNIYGQLTEERETLRKDVGMAFEKEANETRDKLWGITQQNYQSLREEILKEVRVEIESYDQKCVSRYMQMQNSLVTQRELIN